MTSNIKNYLDLTSEEKALVDSSDENKRFGAAMKGLGLDKLINDPSEFVRQEAMSHGYLPNSQETKHAAPSLPEEPIQDISKTEDEDPVVAPIERKTRSWRSPFGFGSRTTKTAPATDQASDSPLSSSSKSETNSSKQPVRPIKEHKSELDSFFIDILTSETPKNTSPATQEKTTPAVIFLESQEDYLDAVPEPRIPDQISEPPLPEEYEASSQEALESVLDPLNHVVLETYPIVGQELPNALIFCPGEDMPFVTATYYDQTTGTWLTCTRFATVGDIIETSGSTRVPSLPKDTESTSLDTQEGDLDPTTEQGDPHLTNKPPLPDKHKASSQEALESVLDPLNHVVLETYPIVGQELPNALIFCPGEDLPFVTATHYDQTTGTWLTCTRFATGSDAFGALRQTI